MNHGLEIRSKPTIPDFFSPPQKKRAPKERFPVVNPMAKKLEISSTLNRKNRFEKDGLFWLQSFTNQIGRNKEMDYSIWNKWHIHIRYMICIYIYYLYVYIYNLYVYIYIYYIHTCTYIYIYTHLSNSWVYWAYRQILGPLTHQIPWIGSHLQIDPFLALQIHLYRYYIYIYMLTSPLNQKHLELNYTTVKSQRTCWNNQFSWPLASILFEDPEDGRSWFTTECDQL